MTIRRGYVDVNVALEKANYSGQVHYRVAGDRSKPVLILLHQAPSTSEMYELLMADLAGNYYLIAPDFPGFGGSDALPTLFTIADCATVLHAAMTALNIQQALMFGHHTGASVALQWAVDHPSFVKALAMSGPTLLTDVQKENLPKVVATFPIEENGSHVMSMWQRMRGKDPEVSLEMSLREMICGLQLGESYPDAYKAVVEQDVPSQLAALTCPTLVFAGTNDPLYGTLDDAFALLQHGKKAVIEGSRTYVCERNVEEVKTLLNDFFKEVKNHG
jgi:haloalkane dehalogenase